MHFASCRIQAIVVSRELLFRIALLSAGSEMIPANPCQNADNKHSRDDPSNPQDFAQQLILVEEEQNSNDDDCPCDCHALSPLTPPLLFT
jgi:hypothetical protein